MSTGDPLRLACPAMGTRFELVLIGDRGADAARLRAAGEEALDEVRRWHDLLSFFDKASIVARINREAAEGGRPLPVPPDAADLLRLCLELAAATGGAFDIAVGHLMRRAGFRGDAPGADVHTHARTATARERTEPPNPSRPAGISDRSDPPAPAFTLDADNRIIIRAGAALDLGAIGKGWALDRAADLLRAHLAPGRLHAALFHGGTSSITAVGGPWRVALDAQTTVTLTDGSLGLSAPAGRTAPDAHGVPRGHILDPRTGLSASSLAAAAVTGPSAAVCDAWSTALVVNPALVHAPSWPIGYLAHSDTGSGFSTHAPPGPLPPFPPQPLRVVAQGTPA